jgi:hypothetical protein
LGFSSAKDPKAPRRGQLRLGEFYGGYRPFAFMAIDRDPQTVQFIKPNIVDYPSRSISEDGGFADELSRCLLEFGNSVRIVVARAFAAGMRSPSHNIVQSSVRR